MKAAVYYDIGDIRYEEVDKPTIGFGEVLVKMEACGLCGTDIHKMLHKTVDTPVVLGHEAVGKIVEVGEGVEKFKVGDRVFFAHHVPCFTCEYCIREKYTLCNQFKETNIHPGGFSEYIRVPRLNVENTMHIIPESLSYREATLIEPLSCCLYGLKKLNIRYGDKVLIMGAGQVGALFCQLIKSLGVGEVFVSDISDYKLEKIKDFGVSGTINVFKENIVDGINELTNNKGVNIAIVAAGVPSLLKDAINCVDRGGQVLVFSPFNSETLMEIDGDRFFNDEISVIGSYSSTPYEYDIGMNMIANKEIDGNKMITHVLKLSELEKALNMATDTDENSMKIIIEP